jgi:hypothetical protein
LYRTVNKLSYRDFILRNADSIWAQSRNSKNQFGLCWAQKFDQADAARQSAAIDTLNASIVASRTPIVLQAETATLHNLVLEAVYTGYQGAGYVANWNRDGQWLDFTFTLPEAGRFPICCGCGKCDSIYLCEWKSDRQCSTVCRNWRLDSLEHGNDSQCFTQAWKQYGFYHF